MKRLIDTHQHMAFSDAPLVLAEELHRSCVDVWCATVTPQEYKEFSGLLTMRYGVAEHSDTAVGLGLHPWWVHEQYAQRSLHGGALAEDLPLIQEFIEELQTLVAHGRSRIISEIGLDFSSKYVTSRAVQIEVCESIFAQTRRLDSRPWVFSLHGVKSYDELCRIIRVHQEALHRLGAADDIYILHSFGGSEQQLQKAIDLGCYFSLGQRSMRTKHGSLYAQRIPRDRLVLETDLPSHPGQGVTAFEIRAALERTLGAIEEARGESVADALYDTSHWIMTQAHASLSSEISIC